MKAEREAKQDQQAAPGTTGKSAADTGRDAVTFDRRGVQLPAKALVGGIITPQ